MDEDAGEEEMEWLMEELEAPPSSSSSSSQRGRSHHGNGHIRTKRVNADGLRSFTLDEQEDDSEDEVLSVPGVRVLKPAASSRKTAAHGSVFLQVSPAFGRRLEAPGAVTANHPWLGFRRRATRTSSGSWRSPTERPRAANSGCPPSPTATARQPTGSERRRRTTVTRTSSGCEEGPPSGALPNSSSLAERVRQSGSHETPTVEGGSSSLGGSLGCFGFGGLHLYPARRVCFFFIY